DRASGRFETSSYWAEGQPSWLEALNDSGLADSLAAEPWALSRPLPVYERSRGEALWPDEADVGGFPYPPAAEGSTPDRFAPSFATRPYLDELTFAVARAAVEHHGLGEDEIPDLLWVGASAADFIGHGYGPFSREVQDHFLRLDAMLGDFLAWLDERLGGAYVVALSSDHGVLPMPEELARRGYDAGRIPADSLATSLRRALDAATTAAGVDAQVAAGLIVLDAYMMFPEDVAEPTRRDIRSRTAATLRRLPGIADVVTLDEVQDSTTARPLVALYRNSWFPGRSPDLWIRPRDGWLAGLGDRITAHIAPYDYDLRVPLILAGPGIVPGRYGRAVATVDLAPTLAALLAVEAGDVDGSPLHEALAGGIDNR
ncbi:MAG: hypothetical protein GWM90_17625, partial [Gemmatimonadetes bacterium]|nr:hypothetical protein [Gemmatimonadota bacterium]NIQ56175.1 hypothetical protein [Gemmatimonadota bacterium]NIU76366.1 hypothetical protein [Gammaproteobacteria bacterium]NIX45846.1 hypothetical protein [Gemmatimonadota bacterium]NIY10152.1 hypothetical protein [Gemmatimonadota bacterium]